MPKLKTLEIMIDIETLGTSHKAPVISIGAVIFDINKTYGLFYATLNIPEQINSQIRVVDFETIKWWMNQDKKAKAVFKEDTTKVVDALKGLATFIENAADEVYIWANGPSFDVSILESLYKDFNLPIPWKYSKIMDFRTVKRFLGKDFKIEYSGVSHNALDDAQTQVKYIQKCIQYLHSLKK